MRMVKAILALDKVTLPKYNVGAGFLNGTLGDVISQFLPYVLVLAGVAMLVVVILGGLTMMTAAGDPGKMKQGQGMVQGGVVGFVIVFVAFFVTAVVEVMFGVKIL